MSPHGHIRTKAMFGGHGIYCNDFFVAIIVDDALYFKTNENTKKAFIAKGCQPFVYESRGRKVAMSYFEAPNDAIDSSDAIAEWLSLALRAAHDAPPKKRR